MTESPFFHGTFTLSRVWAARPDRVFAAWSDPDLKAQWFTGPAERWTLLRRSMDFGWAAPRCWKAASTKAAWRRCSRPAIT